MADLTADQFERIFLIAGLYGNDEGYLGESDLDGLARHVGAFDVNDNYRAVYDRLVAVEALRVYRMRFPDSRERTTQRIAELLKEAQTDVDDSGAIPSDAQLANHQANESAHHEPGDGGEAVEVHNAADSSHEDIRAAIDAAVAGEGVDLTNYVRNSVLAAHAADDDPHHKPVEGSGAITVDNNQTIGFAPVVLPNLDALPDGASVLIVDPDDDDNPKRVAASLLGGSDDDSGVDEVARQSAAEAQGAADTAQERADNAFTAAGLAHAQANNAAGAAATNLAAILVLQGAGPGGSTLHVTTAQVNIAMVFPNAGVGDYVFQIRAGVFALFRVISVDDNPYLTKYGETATGGLTAGALAGLLKTWVFSATDNPTASELGLGIHTWALAGGPDVPYSAVDSILESWAVVLSEAARLEGNVPEHIPNERLPVNRFLPEGGVDETGKIPKIDADGAWALADDLQGSGGAATSSYVPRWRFVRGEDTADPIANAGKVYMGFRYVDIYNLTTDVRSGSHDFGAFGYIYADQRVGYTVAPAGALDIKALLAQSEITTLINLVTALPAIANAVWGALYGLGPDGVVDDIHYRRNEIQTQVAFSPAQLATGAGQTRRIWGFSSVGSNLSLGFQKGGGLSPEIAKEFTEERLVQSDGTVYYQTTLRTANPLFNSAIGMILQWKSGDEDFNVADRQITLFRDQTFVSSDLPTQRQYVTDASHHASNLPVGGFYFLQFHVSGGVNPLVVHAQQAFRRVADDEDLAMAQAEVRREIEAVSADSIRLQRFDAEGDLPVTVDAGTIAWVPV